MQACRQDGYEVAASSPCQDNGFRKALEDLGYRTHHYLPNDPAFDGFVRDCNPDVVVFDRFMLEEQFSWRVRAECPEALRILDTSDLHALRRIRQRLVVKNMNPLELKPADLACEDLYRELAAILRSDLSLLVSDAELEFLKISCGISAELLLLSRFAINKNTSSKTKLPSFEERAHFMMIGNYTHAPNRDAFEWLKDEVWPAIAIEFKNQGKSRPELHVYGSYIPESFKKFDDPTSGYRVKGWAHDACETLKNYRVNLAPLRFGAGIKGKVLDGWVVGTPCLATPIAAEGMHEQLSFGGYVGTNASELAKLAVQLYTEPSLWSCSQDNASRIVEALYDRAKLDHQFRIALCQAQSQKLIKRQRNLMGAILWREGLRSTEFFSRWIEAKNQFPKQSDKNKTAAGST